MHLLLKMCINNPTLSKARGDIVTIGIEDFELTSIHPDFGVPRYEKYRYDLIKNKYTKMCMTHIINADMMIATFGEELYNQSCKEVLATVKDGLITMGLDSVINLYVNDYRSFLVVANDDIGDSEFEMVMRAFYEQYQRSTAQATAISGVSRFVIVLGEGDMVDRAKSALYMHKKNQNNYIIAANEKAQLTEETEHFIKVFELINYAIENDRVFPYYQGLHNNVTGCIDKYEALMRVGDRDGKIYPPGLFLDVAKKFKLYPTLSKILIGKALDDFRDKKSSVSINLSLYDIESDEFSEWFFKRLESFPDRNRLIIEFVETEDYKRGDQLFQFLKRVTEIGCKIAVDDFGVGFSTYTSVIALKPNIVKIDGDIIRNLCTNKDSLTILNSICYMSKLIGAKTVAEFVEDADIQKILIDENVTYSQGYYFAKPTPFAELIIE